MADLKRAPWRAKWSFTTSDGVASGGVEAESFAVVLHAVERAAENSLSDLSEAEGDAMDAPWNRFISSLELHAEDVAMTRGKWRYLADGWADISVEYAL